MAMGSYPDNAADAVQLVKIVKHNNYTVPAGGITCAPWDGKKGGVFDCVRKKYAYGMDQT